MKDFLYLSSLHGSENAKPEASAFAGLSHEFRNKSFLP